MDNDELNLVMKNFIAGGLGTKYNGYYGRTV